MNLEVEKTYTFSRNDSKNIIGALASISNSTKNIHLKKIKITNALHILLIDERPKYKNRFKILLNDDTNDANGQVKIIYSPKIRVSNVEEVLQTYLEENILLDELNNHHFFPLKIHVKAVYFKKKIKFNYNINDYKVRIAVDQLSAINPVNIKQTSEPYFNMEIEGKDSTEIDNVANQLLSEFKSRISFIDMDESKEAIASLYCSKNTILQFQDCASLISYAQSIKKECVTCFEDVYSILELNN